MDNKCDKGKPCGSACIEKADKCQQSASKEVAAALDAPVKSITLNASAKLIASGSYGNAYLQGDAVIKESKKPGKGIGKNEASIQAKANRLGIAPAVLNSSENLLAMEAWKKEDGWRTLSKFPVLSGLTKNEKASFTNQIQTLHANGIAHGDLHGNNFMANKLAGKTGIIDFGLSVEANSPDFKEFVENDIIGGSDALGGFVKGSAAEKFYKGLTSKKADDFKKDMLYREYLKEISSI